MAASRRTSLSRLINRLLELPLCEGGRAMEDHFKILGEAVDADAFAMLQVHPGKGNVRILGGSGLRTPVDKWQMQLETPCLAEQTAHFPDAPALAVEGSFTDDPFLNREGVRSLLLKPVAVGEMYLVTTAFRRESRSFSRSEVEKFAAVSGVINLVGRCCYLEHKSGKGQDRDALTGLGQFTSFHEGLGKELSRARRGVGCVTVGILSLENTGKATPPDDAIVAVAEVLEEQLRNFDTLTRYSSTEFAFVLPDLKVAEGLKVMERVQGEIEAALAPLSEPSWTCIGLAGYPDDAASLERLIEMAEAAANQAKEAGNSAVRRWKE